MKLNVEPSPGTPELSTPTAAHRLDIHTTQVQPHSCPAHRTSDVAWEAYEALEELGGELTGNAEGPGHARSLARNAVRRQTIAVHERQISKVSSIPAH